MQFVFDFISNLIYMISFVYVGDLYFDFRRKNQRYEKIFLLIIVLFVTVLWQWDNLYIQSVVHGLSVLMVLGYYYKETLKTRLLLYIGGVSVIGMLATIFEMIVVALIELMGKSYDGKLIDIISQMLLLLYIWLCGKYFKRRFPGALKRIETKYFLFFVCILFMDVVITLPLEWAVEDADVKRKGLLTFVYIGVVIGLLIQIVLLINALVTRNVFKEKERLARQFLESQNEHYLYLEKREESTKKFRHDIRNHITLLQHFMSSQEYDKAEEYLDVMNEKVEAFGNHISVHNGIADAILNKFYSEAEEKGIELRVKGHFPMECHIVAYDICTVLSNLLNNALLAEYQCKGEAVEVGIRYTEDELYLQVENDYAHELQISNGEFRTTKTELGHGYGLANVRECVERTGGHMTISTENQRFKVMLCMRNEKEE